MKITITNTTQTKQEIDIETPAYFKDHYRHYKIEEGKVLSLSERSCYVLRDTDITGFDDLLADAVKGTLSNAGEFQNVLNVFLDNLNS
jgi:molybdopterin-guanine dinucleotide biosynthesis protein